MTAGPGPVAILAGSGDLPLLIADRLRAKGRPCRILAFRGFAGRALLARADATVGLVDVRGAIAWLDRWQPSAVTLAGGVRRPSAAVLLDAFSLLRNRDEVARVIARGDDNLLRGAVGLLEERGHTLVGVRDLAPELLAEPVTYGARAPTEADRAAIETGFSLLDTISAFDIGQAAAVRGRRILAIEGPEGTDRMLARIGRRGWRAAFRRDPPDGILAKGPKRGQDLRVDLPAIGPRTILNAARAGLAGIAVASGHTLVIDRPGSVAMADRLGLFLVGIERPEAGA